MTTLIIEPHADDVWLSLGQHLLDRAFGDHVVIGTVYGDERRMAETQRYATRYGGARWVGTGLPEGGIGNGTEWTTDPPHAAIREMIDSFQPDRIVGPLGLQHPEHRAVVDAIDALVDIDVARYVELPYSLKRKNHDELQTRLDDYELHLVSARVRTAAANTAAHLFKTQSQFWHFNRQSMTGAMELVLA